MAVAALPIIAISILHTQDSDSSDESVILASMTGLGLNGNEVSLAILGLVDAETYWDQVV